MDKIGTEQLAFSIPCQSVHKKPKLPPRNSTEIPKKVGQTYRVLGTFPKWEIHISNDRLMFSQFGYPLELVSDTGPPFRIKEIKHKLKHFCFY